ncbi:MAG: hypothetical protein Q7S74_06470 [Nanoarchaeota archaeon]|nr:hypothetical protein [Nanoarchaeota archaeon]
MEFKINPREVIGIDIDDSVLEFNDSFREFIRLETGMKIPRKAFTSYDFWKTLECGPSDEFELVKRFYRSTLFDNLKPREGAVDTIHSLASSGYGLLFISSRFAEGRDKTKSWLERYFRCIRYHSLFSGEIDGDGMRKADICLQYGARVMIEDSGSVALDCSQRNPPIRTFLFNQPWNSGVEHDYIVPVEDWRSFNKEFSIRTV